MADKFCYVCGDVGYAELIVTCTKCKVVCEHLYCMPNRSHDVPKSWFCGNCTLEEAKSSDDSGLQVQPKMPRHAKTSKVKFLPTEEVIKLSSGGVKEPSKLNTAFGLRRASKSRKVFDSSMPRPLFQASKESQERTSAVMPPRTRGVKKQALAPCLPPMLVGPVQTFKKVKVTDTPACTSVSRHDLPITNTANINENTGKVPSPSSKFNRGEVPSPSTKLEDMEKQKMDALIIQEILSYRDYLPSLHASWKGGFQFVDTHMAGEFYDGFLAKPPCVVCGRVYELTRKIPPILQVKLLSRSDIWGDLFHDECPDLADVALYFFLGNNERSRTNNSCLFELMEREDLLIRSLIDGGELILFTCRQLDLLSQYVVNMLNAEYLLFGVFREIEDDQSPFPMIEYGPAVSPVKCDSRVPLLVFTPNRDGKHDEDNAVKREIDIKGGNTAEKSPANDVDSTIQRLLLEFGSQKSKESDVNAVNMNAQLKDQEPASIAATSSYSRSLSKVKTEPSVIKGEGNDGKKCLQMEHCLRMAPIFSIDGSQNMSGLTEQDAPKRVAEKYLQIFNAGIKKERW